MPHPTIFFALPQLIYSSLLNVATLNSHKFNIFSLKSIVYHENIRPRTTTIRLLSAAISMLNHDRLSLDFSSTDTSNTISTVQSKSPVKFLNQSFAIVFLFNFRRANFFPRHSSHRIVRFHSRLSNSSIHQLC